MIHLQIMSRKIDFFDFFIPSESIRSKLLGGVWLPHAVNICTNSATRFTILKEVWFRLQKGELLETIIRKPTKLHETERHITKHIYYIHTATKWGKFSILASWHGYGEKVGVSSIFFLKQDRVTKAFMSLSSWSAGYVTYKPKWQIINFPKLSMHPFFVTPRPQVLRKLSLFHSTWLVSHKRN